MNFRGLKQAEAGANGYIGVALPRAGAKRLISGRGQYVDDLHLARTVHAVFVRSPHAHARIADLDTVEAASAPGVVRIITGKEIAEICQPYIGTLAHVKGMRSAPQFPLAVERACWQGEPVVAVVADTRARAEDAAQLIQVEWEELPPVTDAETALDPATPVIHPELGSNLCFERSVDTGGVAEAFARAERVVEVTFSTGRHTAVTLEPRAILANFDSAEGQLTVWHSTQVPYMMQWLLAHHFRLDEAKVRVIAPDVGGGFGLKIHAYGDELSVVASAILTGRPVKFVADRLESFVSDVHARDHRVKARMAVAKNGEILAVEADDLYGIGPYSVYPRGSANEGIQVSNLVAAGYRRGAYRARTRAVFQNKAMYGQYRAVGHPVACMAGELLIDLAADALAIDPAEFRRRNYVPHDAYPYQAGPGLVFERLSQHEALAKLLEMMDYPRLRAEQAQLWQRGVFCGIGFASFIENSNPSAATYGQGGVSISSQDACTMKLTATGGLTVAASTNEIGQGASAVVAQIAATAIGAPLERVKVVLGDTEATPYGGGNWGSRGTGIAGEAVFQAGKALRQNILTFVARIKETEASLLDIRSGTVVEAASGVEVMTLEEIARTAYFRTDQVPRDFQPELTVTRSYAQKTYPGVYTNGIQASWLQVDVDTGFITLYKHWVVDDCGTVVNPLLVDEQIRGAAVQGIGAALFEQCVYSAEGQLMNGSLIDYLVPMAGEMPDIEVGHTCSPTKTSELGAKGAGEAGTAGASAAVLNAVNDALKPFGRRMFQIPVTPERVLRALGKI